jgi:hypothetical protein
MTTREETLALWLSRKLVTSSGLADQVLLVDDIADRISEGASYKDAMRAVSKHDARAGDFGLEITGSMVAIALMEGLRVFWGAYIKKLEETAGDKAAVLTVDFIKRRFATEVKRTTDSETILAATRSIQEQATSMKIPSSEVEPLTSAENFREMND